MHMLVEEGYAKNNVVKQITEGISIVTKKKHVRLHIHTDITKIPKGIDICAVIAQSLSFAIKAVEELSRLSVPGIGHSHCHDGNKPLCQRNSRQSLARPLFVAFGKLHRRQQV